MAEPLTDEDLEYLIRDHHTVYDRDSGASGCAEHCADYLFPDGCLTSRLAAETLRHRKAIAKVREIHHPHEDDEGICAHGCGIYPCVTAQALGETT